MGFEELVEQYEQFKALINDELLWYAVALQMLCKCALKSEAPICVEFKNWLGLDFFKASTVHLRFWRASHNLNSMQITQVFVRIRQSHFLASFGALLGCCSQCQWWRVLASVYRLVLPGFLRCRESKGINPCKPEMGIQMVRTAWENMLLKSLTGLKPGRRERKATRLHVLHSEWPTFAWP